MSEELSLALELYTNMTRELPHYSDWLEAENVLFWRDVIQESLDAGARLSVGAQSQLDEADDRLVAASDVIVRRFPEVYQDSEPMPPRFWWWHLDKGPRVREEATEAA